MVPWWYPPIGKPIGSPSPRHPHYLAVAPALGGFLSVVRSGERLRWQHPSALFGAGADGHPEAPDRRPLGACSYRRQCAECSPPRFIGGLPQTVMGERKAAFSILVVSTKRGVLVVFRMVDDCWLLKGSRCSFCVAFVR